MLLFLLRTCLYCVMGATPMMSMSLQPYLFVCTDAEQRVHKVASFGDLPAGVKFPVLFKHLYRKCH